MRYLRTNSNFMIYWNIFKFKQTWTICMIFHWQLSITTQLKVATAHIYRLLIVAKIMWRLACSYYQKPALSQWKLLSLYFLRAAARAADGLATPRELRLAVLRSLRNSDKLIFPSLSMSASSSSGSSEPLRHVCCGSIKKEYTLLHKSGFHTLKDANEVLTN